MVAIIPFRGYTYNKEEFRKDGGRLLAPPYDVLDKDERRALYQSHPHNFLHVDLGEVLPGDVSDMSWHDRAASLLREWIESKVLIRREVPTIFVMKTEWTDPITGERAGRCGFVSLMRLEDPTRDARIRLHEQTFSYHKEERLDLMRKTGAQLSPIFGFFPDPHGRFLEILRSFITRQPSMAAKGPEGQVNKLFFLEDPKEIEVVSASLKDTTVYIADGHHRYMTALNYRNWVREKYLKDEGKPLPDDSLVNYVMTYLCPMSEKGLKALPTHRILGASSLSNEEILKRLEEFATVKVYSYEEGGRKFALDTLTRKMAEDDKKGLSVFGLILKRADYCAYVKIKEKAKEALARENPERSSLTLLDVSLLTNVILGKAMGVTEEEMDDPDCISYISSVDEAAKLTDTGKRAAFILNPTSLAEILKVTESGYLMPRKATYFYPKVANGLVVNIIDPSETEEGERLKGTEE
jgi:uncharacterized protein (DUF1015 family)